MSSTDTDVVRQNLIPAGITIKQATVIYGSESCERVCTKDVADPVR